MLIATTPDALLIYRYVAQTGLPDLTQPQYLNQIASQLPIAVAIFAILAIGLGAGMALINFSQRDDIQDRHVVVGDWMMRSDRLMKVLQHTVLVAVLMLAGFLFCSTLANRQNNWEQARVEQKNPTIAGSPIQQTSPQVSYTTQEPYVYTTQLNGKLVKVQDKKDVTRTAAVSGSNLQVKIDPTQTKSGGEANYQIDFRGDYQVTNPVGTTDRFFFQINPPAGYSLLQNFNVEQDGKRLTAVNPGEYRFPLQIAPGNVSKLRVSYRAQGSPQWVYTAKDGSLANFRMSITTVVPRLNFISGIIPTKVDTKGTQKVFTWAFNQNASVQKPFGVAVAEATATQTGTLPLLLLLAPGIFLWWMLLLYFSIPIELKTAALAGFTFFVGMFILTYFSRLTDPLYVWTGISIGLLGLVWGIGRKNWRISLAAVICTISGAIIPVYGFLIGYRGLTLSIAGLLSIIWLAVRNWYDVYQLEPKPHRSIVLSPPEASGEVFTRHDLLEESAKHNQLNPAASDAEEIARQLREKGAASD
jgi:hypothetical protein